MASSVETVRPVWASVISPSQPPLLPAGEEEEAEPQQGNPYTQPVQNYDEHDDQEGEKDMSKAKGGSVTLGEEQASGGQEAEQLGSHTVEEELQQSPASQEEEGRQPFPYPADAPAVPKATSPAAQQHELPPVILITTVDIGGGKSDCIELRKGGDPTSAARTFCEKHNLPPHIIAPLTQHILDNLSKAKQVGADVCTPSAAAGGLPRACLHACTRDFIQLNINTLQAWLVCAWHVNHLSRYCLEAQ